MEISILNLLSDERMMVNNELQKIWKEMIMSQ
jgi:hypothetical protein